MEKKYEKLVVDTSLVFEYDKEFIEYAVKQLENITSCVKSWENPIRHFPFPIDTCYHFYHEAPVNLEIRKITELLRELADDLEEAFLKKKEVK